MADSEKFLNQIRKFNRWQVRLGLIFVIVAAFAGVWLVLNTKPIPGKIRQGLRFPLYYPYHLPKGYAVDVNSFRRHGDVVVFGITGPNGKTVAISEQSIPAGYNLSQRPSGSGITLPDQDNFTTGSGTAQISFWGTSFVSSLVTPNTWVILNISGFTKQQGELVTQSFRPL